MAIGARWWYKVISRPLNTLHSDSDFQYPDCIKTGHISITNAHTQVGVVDIKPEDIKKKGRLMPGNIFLVDFDEHRVVEDKEMKER